MSRAPSVITYFHPSSPGDTLVQSVCVPPELCSLHTYYCCLNWNMGKPGGGYCGIQDHPDGKCFIFSLWDPPKDSTSTQITPVFVSEGKSFTERFGGEGEGLKYMNFQYDWKPDQWYTLVARRWDHNKHSYFGLWVLDVSAEKWTKMVIMDYPLADIYFESPVACFVENWFGNGENVRGAKYKDTFIKKLNGDCECLNKGRYFVNQEEACENWNDNFKIESENDECILMQTGGSTKPTNGETKGYVTIKQVCKPVIPLFDS